MSVIAFKITDEKAQVAFDGRCIHNSDCIASENYKNNIKLIEYTHLNIDGDNVIKSKEKLLENILHNEERN